MSAGAVIGDATEVAYWRERATLAEGRLAVAEERLAGAEARVLELAEQVAVLSRMLFGQSSEKAGPGKPGDRAGADGQGDDGQEDSGQPGGGQAGKRGQRPGSKGHGRRDYSGLETREEIHDVPDGQREPRVRAGVRVPGV